MRYFLGKCFLKHPKFRHNLWLKPERKHEITYLTVSNGNYEIPATQAEDFLKIRSHCTGHNTINEISKRCSFSPAKINEILIPFHEAGITHPTVKNVESITTHEVEKQILTLSELFGEHLAKTSIAHEILSSNLKKEVVLGWLCETYHYIKNFPKALDIAVRHSKNDLKKILQKYAAEEKGHEIFILKTLMAMGFKKAEIESSVPLVSTRSIQMILEDLFSYEPMSVFIVASIIESAEYHEQSKKRFCQLMKKLYDIPEKTWAPFFQHIKIDTTLGHQNLLKKNKRFFKKIDKNKLDELTNKLHDLKHAFDLQSLEIKTHYSKLGAYIPRQFIGFSSI